MSLDDLIKFRLCIRKASGRYFLAWQGYWIMFGERIDEVGFLPICRIW